MSTGIIMFLLNYFVTSVNILQSKRDTFIILFPCSHFLVKKINIVQNESLLFYLLEMDITPGNIAGTTAAASENVVEGAVFLGATVIVGTTGKAGERAVEGAVEATEVVGNVFKSGTKSVKNLFSW